MIEDVTVVTETVTLQNSDTLKERRYLMNPKIIICGYDRLLKVARSIQEEITIPSGVNVEFGWVASRCKRGVVLVE